MTLYQILCTLFYLGLALFAFFRSWPHEGRAQVGLVLFLSWTASNVIFWTLPVDWRPQTFSIIEVLFALTAAKAGREVGSRVSIVLITMSVLAIAANTAFSFSLTHTVREINTYEILLNAIFATQCLVTGFWGAVDEFIRTGHFPPGPFHRRRGPKPAHHSTNNEAG